MNNLLLGDGRRVFEPVWSWIDCQIMVILACLRSIWMKESERVHSVQLPSPFDKFVMRYVEILI